MSDANGTETARKPSIFRATTPATCDAGCGQPLTVGQRLRWGKRGSRTRYHDWCGGGPAEGTVSGDAGYHGSVAEAVSDATSAAERAVQALQELLDSRPTTGSVDVDTVKAIVADYVNAERLAEMIEAAVKAYVLPTVTIETADGRTVEVKSAHPNMATLARYVLSGRHVYLHGPAGSGKSTAAEMLAAALERPFGYVSLTPQSMESRLIGYMDAQGRYVATLFRTLYEHGGLFCIDEMDNASGALLTALNSALANGKGAFPDRMVDRHPEFTCVATGNTAGRGGKVGHGERRPFDVATSDRYRFLHWPIDQKLERTLALAENPKADAWVTWVQAVRTWAEKSAPTLSVTPRASIGIAQDLRDGHAADVALHANVWRGLDAETISKAVAACPLPVGA